MKSPLRSPPPLWLDYRRPPPGRQRSGWLLLLAAVLTLAWLVARHGVLTGEIAAVEAQLARAEREQPAAATDAAAGAAGAPLAAAEWEKLFAALEAAGAESVTLLSLRPGPADVQLGGEALDYAAAIDYAQRLNTSGVFGSAYLTQTEVLREHPRQPVRFALLAQWPGQAAAPGGKEAP